MPRWAIMKRSILSGGPVYAIALAAFGGSLATTALGILLDHAGTHYRSDLTSSLTEGRAAIRDFSLSHPHGLFQLDGLLAQQAQTLAYADAAYWTAIAALLFLPLVPFLPAMGKG